MDSEALTAFGDWEEDTAVIEAQFAATCDAAVERAEGESQRVRTSPPSRTE